MLSRMKNIGKLFVFILLLSLSLTGFGLPIPLYEESRNRRRQIVTEWLIEEDKEKEDELLKHFEYLT